MYSGSLWQQGERKMEVEPQKAMFIGDGGSEELRGAKGLATNSMVIVGTNDIAFKEEYISKIYGAEI